MRELLLASFGGIQYGIWRDEIQSIKDIKSLHRIPLGSKYIAGIMIDEDRPVMLADLPVCLGYESTRGSEKGSILLLSDGEELMGFAVNGELRTQTISTQLLFSLPEFLKTPVFDSCAVHGEIPIPIPIINTRLLYSRIKNHGEDFSADSGPVYNAHHQDVSSIDRIRIFFVADEIFAVSAEGMEEIPAKPGPITPLPNQPPHVKGVTFSKGRLLPVIDLSQRMLSQRAAAGRSMLITEIDGAAFGFLIDSDEEMLSINDVSIKTLPHIVQTVWMKHIVIHAGALIPMIDVTKVLSKGSIDETPAWKRYSPGSEFADQFFKQDVDVVEFSLLGERHALPKVEVEDVIALKSCRTLANESSIVIGVVEHNGEILPVIDIALMFGRHSLATSSWRMILVQNGDFRALIITETVFGDRRLAPATHRKVPIHLPHDLMYGCYPEDKTVRLILNIEAISVHFERSMIKILIPTLSHEMRISPTGTAVGLQNEQMGEVSQSQETVPPEETMEVIQVKPKLESDFRQEEIAYAPVSSSDIQESQVGEGGWSEWDSDDTIEQYEVEKIVSHEDLVSEETIMPEEISAENSEGVLEEVLATPVQRKQKQEEIAEKISMTASVLTDRETEPIHAKSEIFLERAPTSLVSNDSKSSGSIYVEVTFLLQGLYRRCHVVFLGLKCKKMYGAIAVVFIAAIFFVAISNKSDIEKNVKEAELSATNTESIRTQGEQDTVQNVSGHFAEEPLAMLELKIPENMPVDIDVYVVVKDDTLWSISERFTGDPFNYPRIAGENKIAKPDLIFPGQRIRLIR